MEEWNEFRFYGGSPSWTQTPKTPGLGVDGPSDMLVSLPSVIRCEEVKNLLWRVQSRLLMVQRISEMGVWEMDVAGGAVCCDAKARLIMGWNRPQTPSPLSLWRRVHPADRRRVHEALLDAVRGVDEVVVEYRVSDVAGAVRHVSCQVHRECDASGQPQRMIGVLRDITELKERQVRTERAAAAEQVLDDLLRLSLQPLVMEVFLRRALSLVLGALSSFKLLPKGGIFLAEDSGEKQRLKLVVDHAMESGLVLPCEQTAFGNHRCDHSVGQRTLRCCAGAAGPGRYAKEVPWTSSPARYCLPLLSDRNLLGVLVLYGSPEHTRCDPELGFFSRVADVLSSGIMRRRAEAQIEYQAFHDTLTGLPNRRLLLDRVGRGMEASKRRGTHGAVLFIDLDHFKKVNDALGHAIGDDLLRQVAQRLKTHVRREDTVVRLGGDEFVVLLPQLEADPEQASHEARLVAKKLRDSISRPFSIAGREHQITPSIGIALFPGHGDCAEEVLRFADHAMSRAKADGRNVIRFSMPGMQRVADRRLRLENDLRHAIGREEMQLYLQPQVDRWGRVLGAEGLLRWQHSERGYVAPSDFVPLAEESGLIIAIGEWVLEEACRLLKRWERDPDGCRVRHLAVNVSPMQFRQTDFVRRVEAILARTGSNPQRLELELTEGVLLENIQETVDKMQALRALGVRFSIDDFGTGYSSLVYLKRLPLSKLKIDRSFVRDLTEDENDAAIVSTVVAVAQILKLQVIAEGVESEAQFQHLNAIGCEAHQGFYFARPMPPEAFIELCRRGGALPGAAC